MKELTKRQKEVLSFIADYIRKHSYPPTIRDIADHFIMSVKGAYDHVAALRRKNYLKQNDNRSRTMELVQSKVEEDLGTVAKIPIVGTVAAGIPILSEENWEGTITLHQSELKKNRTYFAVKVRGDSMSGAGIMDGDLAIIEKRNVVENGEIAVAVVDDAFTLKRFYKEKNHRIKLQAENPNYKPIIRMGEDVRLVGRLAQIVRHYK
jgi:repressor LexA